MKISAYIIPVFILLILVYGLIKKVKLYDVFAEGAKEAFPLAVSLMPYLFSVLIMSELFETSGLSEKFINFLSPAFTFFGVPRELIKLIIIKPFSGSGSFALLSEIIKTHGVKSYITLCACALYGSSETTFYISAVYFVKCKNSKKCAKGIIVSLAANFLSTVAGCFLCRFFI